jgi:hypothetical protein
MNKLLVFLVTITLATSAYGQSVETEFSDIEDSSQTDDFGSLSIGHNLSTNNRTLNEGQWTLGTLYNAYGITDNWSIGTSTFVILQFQMLNLMTRYTIPIDDKRKIGFDVAYFKTYGGSEVKNVFCDSFITNPDGSVECTNTIDLGTEYDGFLMEAISGKITYSNQLLSNYRFNTTLSYFYYFDDRMPFSFRMDPANNDPFTINLTSLNEIKLSDRFYLNLEGGFWGLNYEYLYYHAGVSLGIQNKDGLMAIGASTTFSPSFPVAQARQFVGYDSRGSVHPEVQLQLFF